MASRIVQVVIDAKDRATSVVKGTLGKIDGAVRSASNKLNRNPLINGSLFIGGLVYGMKKAVDAAKEFEASVRKLAGTAKITGVPLDFLQATAAKTAGTFKLNRGLANDLTTALAKLAGGAGDLALTTPGLEAFLDLGAARGLDAAETLKAVEQSILGIDEGTDKLFGANPSALYDRFAASIGTTAGKLDESQKKQAILNAAIVDGGKVQGSYAKFLKSAAGQQQLFNVQVRQTQVAIGQALIPAITALLPFVQGGVTMIGKFIGGIQLLVVDMTSSIIMATKNADTFFGSIKSGAGAALQHMGFEQLGLKLFVSGTDQFAKGRDAARAWFDEYEAELEKMRAEIINDFGGFGTSVIPVPPKLGGLPSAARGGGGAATGLTDVATGVKAGRKSQPIGIRGDDVSTLDLLPPGFGRGEAVTGTLGEVATAMQEVEASAMRMGFAFLDSFQAAASGAKGLEEATIGAIGGAVKGVAKLKAEEEMAKAASAFADGIWPPNPVAIAAGLKHLGAAQLWNVLGGSGGGRGGIGVGGGGLGGQHFGADQRALQESRGTVTIRVPREAIIRPTDPAWVDFMAETAREANGRNIVMVTE